jgi:hypothetical protein
LSGLLFREAVFMKPFANSKLRKREIRRGIHLRSKSLEFLAEFAYEMVDDEVFGNSLTGVVGSSK